MRHTAADRLKLGKVYRRFPEPTLLRSALGSDVILGAGAHVRVIGKGRKERCTPLTNRRPW